MSGRSLKIALAASVVVNVFTIGAVGGLVYERLQPKAVRAAPGNLVVQAAAALTPAEQAAFRQMLRERMVQDRPLIRESRQARRRAMDQIGAPAFDQAAVNASLAQARADDTAVRTHIEEGVTAFAAGLSPAERAAFADGFRKAALARWIANHPGKTAAPAP
jgi:uncharacterized membrane protein